MTENREALPRQFATVTPSLQARIADELRHNDECGTGPLSDGEYMDDAAAILRIVLEHKDDALIGSGPINMLIAERDRLRAALEPFVEAGRKWAAKDYIEACERAREALNGGKDRG